MASRKIEDLHPDVQDRARTILAAWKEKGLDVLVTCTYRSNEEQDELYAQGRTKPGMKVTKARAGESQHNYRLAIDVVPIVNGKPVWDAESPLWHIMAAVARSVDKSVAWGGNWPRFKDFPHFEWRDVAASSAGDHGGLAASPGGEDAKDV